MKLIMHTGGIAQTNCFVIADEQSGDCVLFDAPDHTVAPVLEQITTNGWNLKGLWLTHGHFDHLADHQVVSDRFPGCPILIHPLDEPKLTNPGASMFGLPFTIPPGRATQLVNDNDELTIGSMRVRVLHTPGHCAGHVSYFLPDQHVLVGGDLIICGAVGRTDLHDSDEGELMRSIRRVIELVPPDTTLLPGHCNVSTIREEIDRNPYVALAQQKKR